MDLPFSRIPRSRWLGIVHGRTGELSNLPSWYASNDYVLHSSSPGPQADVCVSQRNGLVMFTVETLSSDVSVATEKLHSYVLFTVACMIYSVLHFEVWRLMYLTHPHVSSRSDRQTHPPPTTASLACTTSKWHAGRVVQGVLEPSSPGSSSTVYIAIHTVCPFV